MNPRGHFFKEDEKREFLTYNEAKEALHNAIDKGRVVFHADTPNSFAAFQVILPGGYEIWVNARAFEGDGIFSMGQVVNRA